MKIEFEKEYLRELYEEGKVLDKRHRYQPQIIKNYKKIVDILRTAPNTEFLYKLKNLHYEKKEGDLKDIEVVWVNDKYRLHFISRIEGEVPFKIIICSLQELSCHYK